MVYQDWYVILHGWIFPQSLVKLNFLLIFRKAVLKVCKTGCIKAQTPFSPFFSWIQNVSKKWRLKILVYFCCLFGPKVLQKSSLSLKKLAIIWKYKKHRFQNVAVYISILSRSEIMHILVKPLKITKMARPVGPNCKNTARPKG